MNHVHYTLGTSLMSIRNVQPKWCQKSHVQEFFAAILTFISAKTQMMTGSITCIGKA
jgi:hypothetical protein